MPLSGGVVCVMICGHKIIKKGKNGHLIDQKGRKMVFEHLCSLVTIATTKNKYIMLYVGAVSLYMPCFMNIVSRLSALDSPKSSLRAKIL